MLVKFCPLANLLRQLSKKLILVIERKDKCRLHDSVVSNTKPASYSLASTPPIFMGHVPPFYSQMIILFQKSKKHSDKVAIY